MVWLKAGGSAVGLHPPRDGGASGIAELADQVSEAAAEALWEAREPTNWPVCPDHTATHPLTPDVRGGLAVWTCPTSERTVASVGSLVGE